MDSIADLIHGAENLDELEQALEGAGHKFKSRAKLKKFLLQEWSKAHEGEVRALLDSPSPEIEGLPSASVHVQGTEFVVHGLVHGQRILGARLSEQHRAALKSFIESYDRPPDQSFVLERGLGRLLGLPSEKEIGRARDLSRRVPESRGELRRSVARLLLSLPLIPFLKLFSVGSRNALLREINRTMADHRRLPILRSLYWMTRALPEPIDLELNLATGQSLLVHRSKQMALEMLETARTNRNRVLHGVVGLAHESQIRWYLGTLAGGDS